MNFGWKESKHSDQSHSFPMNLGQSETRDTECDITIPNLLRRMQAIIIFVAVVLTNSFSPTQMPILSGNMEQGTPKQPEAFEKGRARSRMAQEWRAGLQVQDRRMHMC